MGCLIVSKLLNVAVPIMFKEAIDELTTKIPALQTPKSNRVNDGGDGLAAGGGIDGDNGTNIDPELSSIQSSIKKHLFVERR